MLALFAYSLTEAPSYSVLFSIYTLSVAFLYAHLGTEQLCGLFLPRAGWAGSGEELPADPCLRYGRLHLYDDHR